MPHLPNLAPLGALALLAGAYLGRRYWAVIIPLAMLFVSDLILNNTSSRAFFPDHDGMVLFASYMPYTWLSIAAIVGVAFLLLKKVTPLRVLGSAVIASVLFYLVSNFGVWMHGTLYTKDFAGLLECYIAAIPYFRSTLMSNVVFSAVAFTAIEYVTTKLATTKAVTA
jgi:hypothetical protein